MSLRLPHIGGDLGLAASGSLVGLSAHLPEGGNYGLAALGLLLGTVTRYGMRLKDEQPITVREVLIDFMLLGTVALLALWTIDRLNAHGFGAVIVGALFAISQDKIIRTAQLAWERRFRKLLVALGLDEDDQPPAPAPVSKPRARRKPAPAPPAPAEIPDTDVARVGATLRRAHRKGAQAPVEPEMLELLRKLNGED